MKLSVYPEYLGLWVAIDLDRYDGAPDAGPQLIGHGKTKEDAIEDLMDQIEEEENEKPNQPPR